jgi:hypothetical protein
MDDVEQTPEPLVGVNFRFLVRAEHPGPGLGGKFFHALMVLGRKLHGEQGTCRGRTYSTLPGDRLKGRPRLDPAEFV